jgi:hypothetical protein
MEIRVATVQAAIPNPMTEEAATDINSHCTAKTCKCSNVMQVHNCASKDASCKK